MIIHKYTQSLPCRIKTTWGIGLGVSSSERGFLFSVSSAAARDWFPCSERDSPLLALSALRVVEQPKPAHAKPSSKPTALAKASTFVEKVIDEISSALELKSGTNARGIT